MASLSIWRFDFELQNENVREGVSGCSLPGLFF